MIPSWIHAGVWLLVMLTAGVAFLATLLIWRNGFMRGWRAARTKPPTCLGCGYNLSGLTHCRCPECGMEFCLEELWNTPIPSPTSGKGRAPVQMSSNTANVEQINPDSRLKTRVDLRTEQ